MPRGVQSPQGQSPAPVRPGLCGAPPGQLPRLPPANDSQGPLDSEMEGPRAGAAARGVTSSLQTSDVKADPALPASPAANAPVSRRPARGTVSDTQDTQPRLGHISGYD